MEFVNGQNLYRAHKFDWNFFPVCTDSSLNYVQTSMMEVAKKMDWFNN